MAENKNTKSTKVWEPNATQKKFLETVKANTGCTLGELSEIAGVTFTTGCINTLVAKALVKNKKKKENLKKILQIQLKRLAFFIEMSYIYCGLL